VAAAGALTVVLAAAGCGGSSGSAGTTGHASASRFSASVVYRPPRPAPAIALHDQFGRPTTLAGFRGKAVALTFVYSHCRNVCPTMLQALAQIQRDMGRSGRRLQIVAVSVDPVGDTPTHVRRFLAQRQLLHRVRYLLGTRRRLLPIWREYAISSEPDRAAPEQIEHTAAIYLIDRRGLIRALSTESPLDMPELQHDVPLLAHV
jgi:protein SCO1/2